MSKIKSIKLFVWYFHTRTSTPIDCLSTYVYRSLVRKTVCFGLYINKTCVPGVFSESPLNTDTRILRTLCPPGVRINRVPLYTNRWQEKTETKDFYNPRTESRIGYNFVTFGFAFLTATFFSGYLSGAFFIPVILCFHAATNRVAPSSPLYIWDKPDNNTSICSDKALAFEIWNLQSLLRSGKTRQNLHLVSALPW